MRGGEGLQGRVLAGLVVSKFEVEGVCIVSGEKTKELVVEMHAWR